MPGLAGRKILLGVTGGIAAYKAVELVRLLVKSGAEVRVVMTEAATQFVSPLTFQAVSGDIVRSALFDEMHEAAMGHIELARWAEEIVIAPASADIISRLAHGSANDLLTTICLAADTPIWIAPAMNHSMWENAATRVNVELLKERKFNMLGPVAGAQACGESGLGRMLEPELIHAQLADALPAGRFSGIKVVVTAGPTREALDPVRFLGNRSSGKMGYAIARAFAREGAAVSLVSGPVALATPEGVERLDVESAQEMLRVVLPLAENAQIFIGCAAVADYRPKEQASNKIKKGQEILQLELVRNPDILSQIADLPDKPFIVGFAAETEKLLQNAESKRLRKGMDMVAANLVGKQLGFDAEENALHLLWEGGELRLDRMGKETLAVELVNVIGERYFNS